MVERIYVSQGDMRVANELTAMHRSEQSKAEPTWRDYDASNFQRVAMDSRPDIKPVHVPGLPISPNGAVTNMPNSKTVFINGMETSREVAERMGWIAPQGQSAGPFANPEQEAPSQAEETPAPVTKPDTELAGDAALDKLMGGFMGDANAVISEAAETGDVNALADKHGLDTAAIRAVIAGATARADRVIAGTGINIATANHVLSAAELVEARKALVNGDNGRLQAIAVEAVNKLSNFPTRDPKGFSAFWKEHFGDVDHETRPNGQFLVSVEGMGLVPWATAVRLGAIKI
jgi:hypothetical protein